MVSVVMNCLNGSFTVARNLSLEEASLIYDYMSNVIATDKDYRDEVMFVNLVLTETR